MPQLFKVKEILSGNTIKVEPKWNWGGFEGSIVVIHGPFMKTPIPDSTIFKNRLFSLLSNQNIELIDPTSFGADGIMHCRVFLNEVDVSKYFPELTNS